MSTLSERLEAARRAALVDESSEGDGLPEGDAAGAPGDGAAPAGAPANGAPAPSARAERAAAPRASEPTTARRTIGSGQTDRIDELKSSVHVELLKQLGPHLYDADIEPNELDQRVRGVLADVLSSQDRPLSTSDRARVTQ